MRGLCYSIINRKFAGSKNGKTRDSVTPGITGWPYRGVIARRFKIAWAKKEVNGKNTPIPYNSVRIRAPGCTSCSRIRIWARPCPSKSSGAGRSPTAGGLAAHARPLVQSNAGMRNHTLASSPNKDRTHPWQRTLPQHRQSLYRCELSCPEPDIIHACRRKIVFLQRLRVESTFPCAGKHGLHKPSRYVK